MNIICEAGCNFSTMEEAFQFIDRSKELGLFATKFQIFNEANIKNADPVFWEFLRSIMLNYKKIEELFNYGKSIDQEVFFTPMYDCINFLEDIGVNYYKIRYADNMNIALIKTIINTGKPTFMSVGKNYINYKYQNKKKNQLYLLYCIPKYPASVDDYILPKDFRDNFVGISDHTSSLYVLQNAMKHGVKYFEKHICFTKDCLEAKWSITFEELKKVLNNKKI